MANILSKIDNRNKKFIVNELRNLILKYCPEWKSVEEVQSDQQVDALIYIFSNMMEKVIDRLNQSLDRNYMEFLNMIGISPTPPRVAKAPLVFELKADWEKEALIPLGTKVSAQPENQEEVVFETEKDLTVIKPKLIRAVSIDPIKDKWSNQDFIFDIELSGKEAELFRGDSTIIHRLYIGYQNLWDYKEGDSCLTISFIKSSCGASTDSKDGSDENKLELEWYCFDEDGNPKKLNAKVKEVDKVICCKMENVTHYTVTFTNIDKVPTKKIKGYDEYGNLKEWEKNWIFAQLKNPISNRVEKQGKYTKNISVPGIKDIKITLEKQSGSEFNPDTTMYNDIPINMNKDFYPFGDKPKINDAFYIASKEAFSKKDTNIILSVELSDKDLFKLPDTEYIKLYWEYFNGDTWEKIYCIENEKEIYESILKRVKGEGSQGSAATMTATGKINFKCPDIKPCDISGEENYWIRARIIGGNYGSDEEYEYIKKEVTLGNEKVNIAELQYKKASFVPPSIKKLSIKYNYAISYPTEIVLNENNFKIEGKTDNCAIKGDYFRPFLPCSETEVTFYLAFDKDISSLPISLFFPLSGEQVGINPIISWEYWNGRKWVVLSVNDSTRNFTRREILHFVAPYDVKKCTLFGTENYWIRASIEQGAFKNYPKLSTVYTNAVWCRNSNTLKDEILGSSNGEPNQSFQLSRNPVLIGQEVSVRETLIQEEWSQWEEVKTFSISNTDSKHYMLDHVTGIITFGDGMNGMVPPAGVDNIKCSYKQGGGAIGNVKSGAIKRIWDDLSGVDSVTNPITADGGFNEEKPEEAKIRGPHTLKSWERGITCEDVEWMVHEVAPQIAIVKCIPTMEPNFKFVPGKATVIVVPEYDDPKPVPSQELLNEIEAYLLERTSAVLNTREKTSIYVKGPNYIRIGVEAKVKYTSTEKDKIIEGQIIDNLKQFLNPISGGQERTGWKLGHNLYVSEVSSVIKNTPGVDYISNIEIKSSVQCFTLNIEKLKDGYYKPGVSYPKYSAVRTKDNKIIFALAENLYESKEVKSLKVKGFKENEEVKLCYRSLTPRELIVVSVDGDILECRTKDKEMLKFNYPAGSDIVGNINGLSMKSYILNNLSKNDTSFFIKIAVPESQDIVFLCHDDEYVNTTPLKVFEVKCEDVFLEENELVYNGIHFINKNPELIFPYLMNDDTSVVYDLSDSSKKIDIEKIQREDRVYLRKLPEQVLGL